MAPWYPKQNSSHMTQAPLDCFIYPKHNRSEDNVVNTAGKKEF